MLTYLINLHDAQDRLATATAGLNREKMPYTRIEAVDGRGKPPADFPDYDPELSLKFYGRPLKSAEIGCYLSHIDCVSRFLQSDHSHCLVIEDDMVLPPDAKKSLALLVETLATTDESWDVVNLGKSGNFMATTVGMIGDQRLYWAHYFPTTTTSLLWSRDGAAAFLDAHDKIYAPVDHYLRRFSCLRGRSLALSPPLIVPSGAESTIDGPVTGSGAPSGAPPRKTAKYHWTEFRRQGMNYLLALRSYFLRKL